MQLTIVLIIVGATVRAEMKISVKYPGFTVSQHFLYRRNFANGIGDCKSSDNVKRRDNDELNKFWQHDWVKNHRPSNHNWRVNQINREAVSDSALDKWLAIFQRL